MIGTVVNYSDYDSCSHFIKILSGEKIFEIYPESFPANIRIDMQVQFDIVKNTCKPLNS